MSVGRRRAVEGAPAAVRRRGPGGLATIGRRRAAQGAVFAAIVICSSIQSEDPACAVNLGIVALVGSVCLVRVEPLALRGGAGA
jgi:hypothetical protein